MTIEDAITIVRKHNQKDKVTWTGETEDMYMILLDNDDDGYETVNKKSGALGFLWMWEAMELNSKGDIWNIAVPGRDQNEKLLYEESAQELTDELFKLYEGDEKTVLHVLSCVAEYEKDVVELLEYIRDYKESDPDDVVSYAYEILQRRDPNA